jgi:hypothetical protein
MSEHPFKVGDHVECAHDVEWQNAHRDSDHVKGVKEAHKRGRRDGDVWFLGNAAAYMHTDEAYIVTEVTESGGVRLQGFAAQVSVKDLRLSTKPVRR